MNHRNFRARLIFALLTLGPGMRGDEAPAPADASEWVSLFDGESFDGWVAHLGMRGNETSQPLEQIFTINDGTIHVYRDAPNRTKQYSANLRTEAKFSNFHLQVEYRWLDNRFQTLHAAVRDYGILFHLHTDPDAVWPPSVEMQLGGGEPGAPFVTGDIWIIGNTRAQTRAKLDSTVYVQDAAAEPVELGGKDPANEGMLGASYTIVAATKPHGEWNLAEVIVHGSDRAEYFLNGELVNEVTDLRFLDEAGEWQPLESGHISLQAEWAELQYRVVRIRELDPAARQGFGEVNGK